MRRLFECGVYSRAAFNGIFIHAALIRGRRLFEGGVDSNNYGIQTFKAYCRLQQTFYICVRNFIRKFATLFRNSKIHN